MKFVKFVRVVQAMGVIAAVALLAAVIAAVAPASVRHLVRIDSASATVTAGAPIKAKLLVRIPKHAHLAAAIDDGKLKAVKVLHHRFKVSTKSLPDGQHVLAVAFVAHDGHLMASQKVKFRVRHHLKKTGGSGGGGGGGGDNPTSTPTTPGSTTPKPPTTTKPSTTTTPKPPTTTTPKPPTSTTPTTPTTPSDSTAPSTPGALLVTGTGQTSVQVSWHASTDNVGVVGYRVTRSGTAAVTVATTSTAIAGLACGTTVTVAVAALDAAGNASTPASASGSTSACPVVAADHYVSASGSDGNPCSQAAPCASLSRAFAVSSSGQTVSVAPGSYPGQTIAASAGKTGVTFLGNGATTGEIDVYASHLTLQDFNTGGWKAAEGTTDITFKNVNITHGGFYIDSATNVSVLGGVVDGAGQYWVNGNDVKTMSTTSVVPSGILFDGVTIQNYRRAPGSSDHVDCIHVMAVNGLTIRNSRFANCEAFDILFTKYLGPTPTNILIENNFFRCCGSGFYSVQLGGDHGEAFQNVTIRNNSADKGMTVGEDGSNTLANIAYYNNDVPDIGGCKRSGVTADYNVLFDESTKCGSHDLLVASGFASATDLHLIAGAPEINAGLASQAPATDIDGQARPQGSAPDIGADEAG